MAGYIHREHPHALADLRRGEADASRRRAHRPLGSVTDGADGSLRFCLDMMASCRFDEHGSSHVDFAQLSTKAADEGGHVPLPPNDDDHVLDPLRSGAWDELQDRS